MATIKESTYCALTYRHNPVPMTVEPEALPFSALRVADPYTALCYVRGLVLDGVPHETLRSVLDGLCARFEQGGKSRAAAG